MLPFCYMVSYVATHFAYVIRFLLHNWIPYLHTFMVKRAYAPNLNSEITNSRSKQHIQKTCHMTLLEDKKKLASRSSALFRNFGMDPLWQALMAWWLKGWFVLLEFCTVLVDTGINFQNAGPIFKIENIEQGVFYWSCSPPAAEYVLS